MTTQVAGHAAKIKSSEHDDARYLAKHVPLHPVSLRSGKNRSVTSSPEPQLSALATALADITERTASLAHLFDREDTQLVASDLFEVERLLRGAQRRIERALRSAG